jgi:hypothetical protein
MERVLATIERRVRRLLTGRGVLDDAASVGGDRWGSQCEPLKWLTCSGIGLGAPRLRKIIEAAALQLACSNHRPDNAW